MCGTAGFSRGEIKLKEGFCFWPLVQWEEDVEGVNDEKCTYSLLLDSCLGLGKCWFKEIPVTQLAC